jgi:hypothetical protein
LSCRLPPCCLLPSSCGNVLVARELSDALLAKIRWGILTP